MCHGEGTMWGPNWLAQLVCKFNFTWVCGSCIYCYIYIYFGLHTNLQLEGHHPVDKNIISSTQTVSSTTTYKNKQITYKYMFIHMTAHDHTLKTRHRDPTRNSPKNGPKILQAQAHWFWRSLVFDLCGSTCPAGIPDVGKFHPRMGMGCARLDGIGKGICSFVMLWHFTGFLVIFSSSMEIYRTWHGVFERYVVGYI